MTSPRRGIHRGTQNRNGVWTWYHADHLHRATVITDVTGQEVRRLAYRAFGEEVQNQGTGDAPPYTYTGKELDDTGLYYYGARYYDPVLARFLTPDTVYDGPSPQGLNRYSYALNNPILYRDPTGHEATAAYGWQTPYQMLPYAGTFETGNPVADVALASVGGVWNIGAYVANASVSMLGVAYGACETGYNDVTYTYLGHEGIFTTFGLEGDIEAATFALSSMPIDVAAFKQSLAAMKDVGLQNLYKMSSIADETGSLYLGGNASETAKRTDDILVLGRGLPEKLQEFADQVGGRVINNADLANDPKPLFNHIHSEMRKADEILQIMDDIPDNQVTGRGTGQWARAEKIFINQNPKKFKDKVTRMYRADFE